MLLHTVNKSPFERHSLQSCLRFAQAGSSILLLEDGIYAAIQGTQFQPLLQEALNDKKVYALLPDLQARGLPSEKIIEGITLVDYGDFVDLVASHSATQAWL